MSQRTHFWIQKAFDCFCLYGDNRAMCEQTGQRMAIWDYSSRFPFFSFPLRLILKRYLMWRKCALTSINIFTVVVSEFSVVVLQIFNPKRCLLEGPIFVFLKRVSYFVRLKILQCNTHANRLLMTLIFYKHCI